MREETSSTEQRTGAQPLLAYANADRARDYRAIIDIFAAHSARYAGQLKPEEVSASLTGHYAGGRLAGDLDSVTFCLDQLVAWGNLARFRDESAATSLRSYEGRRYTYELTPDGEAAHRALRALESDLGRSGGLQSSMLTTITSTLADLAAMTDNRHQGGLDPVAAFTILEQLHHAFDSLTSNAQTFMSRVSVLLSEATVDSSSLRLFKAETIAYLHEFAGYVDDATHSIRRSLAALDRHDRVALLDAAEKGSGEHDLVGDPGRWRKTAGTRLDGLDTWFRGTDGRRPRVDLLRDRAISAVLAIVGVVERISESQLRPSSHIDDYMALARLFAGSADDATAHQIYRGAFATAPARHYTAAYEDDTTASTVSWWDAPAVDIPTRLRIAGRNEYVRRATRVPDYADSKARAAAEAAAAQRRADDVAATLIGFGETTLAQLPVLTSDALEALCHLLDAAMRAEPSADGTHAAHSLDGQLHVTVFEAAGDEVARIVSENGTLTCPNWTVRIRSAHEQPLTRPVRLKGASSRIQQAVDDVVRDAAATSRRPRPARSA